MMSTLRTLLLFAAATATFNACTSSEQKCAGPGDCPAGQVCTDGVCQALLTPQVDAGAQRDAHGGVYDAGPRLDNGRPAARDASTQPGRDASSTADAGSSMLFDAPPFTLDGGDEELLDDVGPNPEEGLLSLGDECFPDQPEDMCVTSSAGLFCQRSLDGQTGYCSAFCGANFGDAGPPVGDAGNPCGTGCCVLRAPQDELLICRFAPDCQ